MADEQLTSPLTKICILLMSRLRETGGMNAATVNAILDVLATAERDATGRLPEEVVRVAMTMFGELLRPKG